MAQVTINPKTFYNRLDRLYDHWKKEKNQKHWKNVQAFEISVGKFDMDDPEYKKCSIMQTWLLGYEFTFTIMVFTKEKLYILTSKKKETILNVLKDKGNENSVPIEIIPKEKEDKNYDKYYEQLIKHIKDSTTPKGEKTNKIGILMKEKKEHKRDFVIDWYKKIEASGLEQVDITSAFSDVLARKDEEEVHLVKKSAEYVSSILTKHLQKQIEDIIVSDEKTTHAKLADATEELILDPSKNKEVVQHNPDLVDIPFSPVIQSGGNFKLSLNAKSTDEPLHFGTIICLLGAKYKGYCSTIGRTYMIDCSPAQERAYKILEQAYKEILKNLKVNTKACDVYKAAQKVIAAKDKNLLKHFVKSCGYGIGLETKETYLNINATNKKKVRVGMTFVVFVGFENLVDKTVSDPKKRKYSLLIADTVTITPEKCEVLTSADFSFGDVSYSVEEEDDDELSALDTSNIRQARTRHEFFQDITAEAKRKKQQQDLLRKKQEEYSKKSQKKTNKTETVTVSLEDKLADGTIVSYKSEEEFPKLRPNKIYVDQKKETVLLPISGTHVPFHIATIKNVSKSDEGEYIMLRINFKNPSYSFSQAYTPVKMFPNATFIKEMSFRARDPKNLSEAYRLIQELRKRVTQREKDKQETHGLVTQEPLKLTRGKQIPRLRDVYIRPNPKGKKTVGRLEAHENGLRFVSNRGEIVDILYVNIKHAIFQEADRDTIVLLHFHLRHPILVKKKRHVDIQFYTEVMEEYDQLVGRFRRNMSDAESIQEEKRERALKQKLNQEFHAFAKKVEDISNIEFDIPFRELEFPGTPHRSSVMLVPTVNCLVNLTEYPFFLVSLSEIELAYLERISFGLRNFDLIFIFKDYTKPVVAINTIPIEKVDMIKDWLTQCEINYFEGAGSLVWSKIMKTIREDEDWDPWGKNGWNSILNIDEESGEEEEPEEDGDEYKPDSDDYDDDDDDEFKSDEEQSDEEEEYVDDEEDEGKTWEELEREASLADEEQRRRNSDLSDDEESSASRKRKRPAGSSKPSKKQKRW